MCGICGIYGEGNKYSVKEMMSVLEHRGPDSHDSYVDQSIALGHQRLSVIDLSDKGKQPMCNEDGTVWLIVNGELYNYKDLRTDLYAKGHTFKSESDSEIIIHAYEEYAEEFINRLRGMYAIALYDKKQKKLVLARDRIGKKPLYYSVSKKRLMFASELKSLFKGGMPCEINYDMIPPYLMYQYTLGNHTLFKEVYKLPAGHMLVASPEKIKLVRYWHLSEGELHRGSDAPYFVGHLRELLEESVKLRLQSDVPIGSFLSGGIDSSAITALHRKFYSGEIHTFTASFNTHSEAKYANMVSKCLDTTQHNIRITPTMVANDMEKITWHHDEPLGDAATINNYYLAQEAKKYVTVILAGEGGDELFGGYPWYTMSPWIHAMNKIPKSIRSIGQSLIYAMTKGDITAKSYRLSRVALFPLQDTLSKMQLYLTAAMNQQNIQWLTNFEQPYNHNATTPEYVKEPYNQMLAMDCLNKLPEQFLMKADKATMAHAIEERLPLLDQEIIQYAFTIPTKLKRDKYVLRKAVEDLLPAEIVWRPKKGFGTPLVEWMSSAPLKEIVLDRLSHGLLLRDICRPEALEKLIGCVAKGLKTSGIMMLNPANVVWTLFALQTWYDTWFGRK